jgi:hypothetical protein
MIVKVLSQTFARRGPLTDERLFSGMMVGLYEA